MFYYLCSRGEWVAAKDFLDDRRLPFSDDWLTYYHQNWIVDALESDSIKFVRVDDGFCLASEGKILCKNGMIRHRGSRHGYRIYTSKQVPISQEDMEDTARFMLVSRQKSANKVARKVDTCND